VLGAVDKGLPRKEGGKMFTETYIEMVTKAKEIQDLCKYNKGDWFWNGEKPYLYCKSGLGSSNPHDYKWLPTLEDLFGILEGDVIDILDSFYDWVVVDCTNVILLNNLVDIKEFLLCYVMFENYSKLWNPDKNKWEEINEH